jgi:Zn-dependent protease
LSGIPYNRQVLQFRDLADVGRLCGRNRDVLGQFNSKGGPQIRLAFQVKPNWWLHWLLFVATIATTTWAGALPAGVNLLQQPERFAVGLPYSLGFLLILGAHEMGHYLTARRYGIQVTPPFFVPVPFALGTFGAFIKIKSITPNRRSLFDVAVAGPLSGLVFAIPALLIACAIPTSWRRPKRRPCWDWEESASTRPC